MSRMSDTPGSRRHGLNQRALDLFFGPIVEPDWGKERWKLGRLGAERATTVPARLELMRARGGDCAAPIVLQWIADLRRFPWSLGAQP